METPNELKYTSDHEWVRIDGERFVVGITDYAQDALGDVVFVDLPAQGDEVAAGASIAEVESTKSVSEIYAPISGIIAEVNSALEASPELLNSAPYGEGWMFVIENGSADDVAALLDADAYAALTSE